MAGIAMRIGVVFAVLGFGSLILEQFDYEFRLIAWASEMQPWFGIGLGVVGLALIGVSALAGRAKAAKQQQAQQFAPQPPAPGAPQQPGQPG